MGGNKERLIEVVGYNACRALGGGDLIAIVFLYALVMVLFDSKPLNTTPLNGRLRKSPLLFGVPFVVIMVVSSYALVPFMQTKYELQDRKVSKVRLTLPSVSSK